MTDYIANLRISYDKSTLDQSDLRDNPFDQFQIWFDAAVAANILEPNAMTLATSTPDGVPSARIVLLKGVDARGFRFFTNYESQKGRELAANPHAALVFYWDMLHRSVRITGPVERLSADESLAYYHARPRGSQIGAWTSPQSSVIPDRDFLEQRQAAVEQRFVDSAALPLPPFWGGFRLVPETIEFWQGRQNRLHDRFRYTRLLDQDAWQIDRLAP